MPIDEPGDGNGSHVTRAELAAHIRRIDENLIALKEGMDELRQQRRRRAAWISARAGATADRFIPAGFAAAATYFLARFIHRG